MEESEKDKLDELDEENKRLKNEIEGIQTAANLMHTERDNEITAIRAQHQTEMDTYKELMKNAVFSQQESVRVYCSVCSHESVRVYCSVRSHPRSSSFLDYRSITRTFFKSFLSRNSVNIIHIFFFHF